MPTDPSSLVLIVYTSKIANSANDGRTLAVIHGMERSIHGLRLNWTISEEGQFIPLSQRDAWLSKAAMHGRFPILCNGEEASLVTVSGLDIPAGLASGGQPLSDIHIEMPLDLATCTEAAYLLESVAEGAHAFWGHGTPSNAAGDIADQTSDFVKKPSIPPRGLPALKLSEDIPSPEIPHRLGWLNYWSAAASRAIGFPDLIRDEELLSRARRTTTGGWIVPLTDTPLDLDNPKHLDVLLRTYQRFPRIGGRSV